MTHYILVVEDNEDIQKYLKDMLIDNGYTVKAASKGIEALKLIDELEPDLVVLDLMLPDMSGESVCLEIRKKYPSLPIVVLTAKDSVFDKIALLKMGADDYITKPFVTDEFIARIKARLRSQSGGQAKLTIGDLELNSKRRQVKRGDKIINLTPQEFKLLEYLMANKEVVLTREMILNRIWLYSPDIESRVVDVYIGYLRKKIDGGFKQKLIHSIRGFGYTIRE